MAISEDTGNQPVAVHSTTTSATTAAFSPQAGTLLVALLANDGSAAGAVVPTIADSLSGSWTLLKMQNSFVNPSLGGAATVWCRYLSSAPGSMTVTGTWSGTNGTVAGNLVVRCLLGASSTQNGATAGAGGASVAPSATLTPTVLGSWIYGAVLDYTTNTTLTANAQSAIIDQFNDATNGDTWATFKGSASTSALSSTTYGASNANAAFNVAIAEILPAGGAGPVEDPGPFPLMFLPTDDPVAVAPWAGAPDASHDVIVNAGTASITFLSPATRPMMLLALTSESGPGATAITRDDPFVTLAPMLTPDDVLGGMQPWTGAADSGAVAAATTANAGVASMSFAAQSPSAGLSALPGTGSITLAGKDATAAVAALAGTASVSVVAQAPAAAIGTLPGAAAVSISAQPSGTGIAPTAGAALITFAGRSALAGPGGVAGVASIVFAGRDSTTGLAPTAGAASITFAGKDALGGTGTVASAGVASITFTGQDATAGLAALPGAAAITFAGQQAAGGSGTIAIAGAASITFAGQQPVISVSATLGTASMSFAARSASAGLSALPAPGSITLVARGPQTAAGALPGTASVAFTARAPGAGVSALPGSSSVIFTASPASVPGTVVATAGVASISFSAPAPVAGISPVAGVASVAITARSSSVALAVRPGVAVVAVAALSGLSALPQTGTPTLVSGHEPRGTLSGREPDTSASGTETGLITGRQPLSSTSGNEPGTSIHGRES